MASAEPTRAKGEVAALLRSVGLHRRFSQGTMIQQQEEESNGFWLIERGEVMICRFGGDGTLTVYAVLGPGDLFGELAHFAGVPRQVAAVAESEVELVRIDAALTDRLLASEASFAPWLLRSLATQLRAALDRIESRRSDSSQARIAQTLAAMAQGQQDVAITQQQLADIVGVSRVTAGQVLKRLTKSGAIALSYGRVQVVDTDQLMAETQLPAAW